MLVLECHVYSSAQLPRVRVALMTQHPKQKKADTNFRVKALLIHWSQISEMLLECLAHSQEQLFAQILLMKQLGSQLFARVSVKVCECNYPP